MLQSPFCRTYCLTTVQTRSRRFEVRVLQVHTARARSTTPHAHAAQEHTCRNTDTERSHLVVDRAPLRYRMKVIRTDYAGDKVNNKIKKY